MILRRVVLLLFWGLGTVLSAHALTTDDLAAYLGVQSWETNLSLPAGAFEISLNEVANGVITHALGDSLHETSDRPSTDRLVIMISHRTHKIRVVLRVNSQPVSSSDGEPFDDIPMPLTCPLPKTIQTGDYILGGAWNSDGVTAPRHITAVKTGVLLRIRRLL